MSQRTQVMEMLEASSTPVTSKQISEMLGIRIETVASTLTELWKSKKVKRRAIVRNGERGRLYEYVKATSDLEGFESLVLPLSAKKSVKKKKRAQATLLPVIEQFTSHDLPQASTIVATLTIPVNGRSLTLTTREARQLYEQLSALFIGVGPQIGQTYVAHPAA